MKFVKSNNRGSSDGMRGWRGQWGVAVEGVAVEGWGNDNVDFLTLEFLWPGFVGTLCKPF